MGGGLGKDSTPSKGLGWARDGETHQPGEETIRFSLSCAESAAACRCRGETVGPADASERERCRESASVVYSPALEAPHVLPDAEPEWLRHAEFSERSSSSLDFLLAAVAAAPHPEGLGDCRSDVDDGSPAQGHN